MSSSTSSKDDPHSGPEQSANTSQHPVPPQNKYEWFTTLIFGIFEWVFLPILQAFVTVIIMALGNRQQIIDGHEQQASVDIQAANDTPRTPATPHHDSFHPPSMQAEGRNPLPSIATIPLATQLQGAQGFTISGNPTLMNIGTHMGNMTTVNNYGGTHGLENLKEFVSFAALHDSSEQDPTRCCHPGTRKHVLGRLRNWFDNPNATERICWLHGPAGAGKSAIAQTIAHEYKERGVAATFFFYRSDAERSNGNRLFPTLAWQFAFSIPAIKNFIIHALDKTPHLPKKDVETQFEQLVARPTNNIASHLSQPAPVVIIDGLDECSDEKLQRRIPTVIGNAIKDSRVPLHFLICSRPEALIEDVLCQFKDFTLRIDLATLDDANRDIEKYLVDQFSDIRSKRGVAPTWPNPKIIEEFVFKSSGNFIFAATVMRYISDEDCDPEEQLDIVRNLKPCGKASPFALLDELYLEILKQQRDQDFLKTFLALFVGRSPIDARDLHEDDTTLMNVSEKNLHMKLRRMRSLLKFKPFIDVHHKSFLDFLQDPSRSGQYHVSEQDAQMRYLELIVDCVVRHISTAIERPNNHEKCHSSPKFRSIVEEYPSKIVLPVEGWQQTLKPLLNSQGRLLNTSKPRPCGFCQVMRELLLHLMILQRNPHHSTAVQVPDSETVTEQSTALVPDEHDLDKSLSVLFNCFPKTNSVLGLDTVIIECMSSLLAFDYVEIAARVQSVIEAQKLVDIIDSTQLNNNDTFASCGQDAARTAILLVSEIFARTPLLPRSIFLNRPTQPHCNWLLELKRLPAFQRFSESMHTLMHNPSRERPKRQSLGASLELLCQSTFITRILDHNYIIPLLWIYQTDGVKFVYGKVNEQDESVDEWLERSSPSFVTRVRAMLEIGKAIRYIHSMHGVTALSSAVIESAYITLDSNLRAKIVFLGYFAWQVKKTSIYNHEEPRYLDNYTLESNIAAFGKLFHKLCFPGDHTILPEQGVRRLPERFNATDPKSWPSIKNVVWRLIERCRTMDRKTRPTMENVVKEMEAWDLT